MVIDNDNEVLLIIALNMKRSMDLEPPHRRRAIRYYFGGAAEVADTSSGKYLVSEVSEIGRFGCFVKTAAPFPTGAPLTVRLTHNRKLFAASGRVVYALGSKGMGIVFDQMSPQDEAILESWLEIEERNARDAE